LLELIVALAELEHVHVVASSRSFEHRYDPRLRNLSATRLELELPSREAVTAFVTEHTSLALGDDENLLDLLRVPYNLRLVVEHERHLHDGLRELDSDQAILAAIVEAQLDAEAVDAALDLAARMGEREELFVVVADERRGQLAPLIQAGFVEFHEDRALFIHQVMFEYFWARSTVRTGFAKVVMNSGQTTHVRPRLRTALGYLHTDDPEAFYVEVERLWAWEHLRSHLRRLIVTFVARLDDPSEHDARWIRARIDDDDWRTLTLQRLDSPRWFRLMGDEIARVMAREDRQALAAIRPLAVAAKIHEDEVITRLREHWLRPDRVDAVVRVARSFTGTSQAVRELWLELVGFENLSWAALWGDFRRREDRSEVGAIVAEFVSVRLASAIERALAKDSARSNDVIRAVESIDLYASQKLILGHSEVFLRRVWPMLRLAFAMIGQLGWDRTRALVTHGSRSDQDDVLSLVRAAIGDFAKRRPLSFVAFVRTHAQVDSATLQWALFAGLREIAEDHGSVVVDHLVADPSRMLISAVLDDRPWTSRALVEEVVRVAPRAQVERLQAALLELSPSADMLADEELDPGWAVELRRRDVRTRLWMLDVIPEHQRTHEVLQWIAALPAELRDEDRPQKRPKRLVTVVGSPFAHDELGQMPDARIVELFETSADETAWSHPDDRMVGGSIQLSRELAKALGEEPERADRLFTQFEPGKQENPVGLAIAEWAERGMPELVLRWTRWAHERGFSSPEFRSDVARALRKVSEGGLDASTCDMLRSWLRDWPPEPAQLGDDDWDHEELEDVDLRKPVLDSRGGIIPQGAYSVLSALLVGLLRRERPAVAEALDAVREFWWVLASTRVFAVFATNEMRYLLHDDQAGTRALILELLERDPSVLRSDDACLGLIWLRTDSGVGTDADADAYRRLVESLRDNGSARGMQAYAELVAYNAIWPAAPWASEAVEAVVNGDDRREPCIAGVVHVAIGVVLHAKSAPTSVDTTVGWLVALSPRLPESLASLWVRPLERMRWQDDMPVDALLPLVKAAALRPAVLAAADSAVLHVAHYFVDEWSSYVYAFVRGYIEHGKPSYFDDETNDAIAGTIATLQRKPGHRMHGLELIDLLSTSNIFDLDAILTLLESQ
jgi:hypothetical protein